MQRLIETVLLRDWDPIGVKDSPSAHDEYRSYAPIFAALLNDRASLDMLAQTLLKLERNEMGLGGDEPRARNVAKTLLELKSDETITRA